MVARMSGFKSAGSRRAGSIALGTPDRRPEAESMPQHADQVIQLVKQLRKPFHGMRLRDAQRRPLPGAGSSGFSSSSRRQAVRTFSAQDL